MAQKDGGTEQGRVKTDDNLGTKAMSGGLTAGGGVVVEVREKKGPLRAAIPTMPFPLAVICLFLNTFIPGLGKINHTFFFFPFLIPSNFTWFLIWFGAQVQTVSKLTRRGVQM